MKNMLKQLEQWLDSWKLSQVIVLCIVVILLVISTFWQDISPYLK